MGSSQCVVTKIQNNQCTHCVHFTSCTIYVMLLECIIVYSIVYNVYLFIGLIRIERGMKYVINLSFTWFTDILKLIFLHFCSNVSIVDKYCMNVRSSKNKNNKFTGTCHFHMNVVSGMARQLPYCKECL